jgi:hypothetical protein
MTTLFDYQKQLQRFTRDGKQELLNPNDLISYINRARREIAMRCQCVRILTPIAGAVVSATVLTPGSGYTHPVAGVSAPDFPSGLPPFPNGAQATATPISIGGQISSVLINFGGSGYFQPTLSIMDPTGTGATAALKTSPVNALIQGQEVYQFSSVDLTQNPGAGQVYAVKSISILYSNYRYSLPVYAFSVYQAKVRSFPFQYQYVPAFASQYGQGTSGSFYVYPIPSQVYQYELDCFVIPQDLIDDQSVEIIPAPWTDAVPYFAAALAYEELQNLNAAQYYHTKYDEFAIRYSNYARIGRAVNPVGRY